MLAADRPDLVLIGTPPAFHREQTVAALRSGAWVLCEKPLTLSLAEYDEIAAAEDASGGYASVVFQHRYGSGAVHARSLLADGTLGRPLVAHCQTTWYRDAAYYAVPWRGRWAGEGGGPTMGHGIHQYDLLLHLLGEWTEVRAMAARLVHDTESEDVSTGLVRFAGGALATVVNSVLSPDETSRIRIDCERATVELTHLYGHSNDDWRYTPALRTSQPPAPTADVPSSHTAQLTALLDAHAAGTRPPGSGPDARSTLEMAGYTGLQWRGPRDFTGGRVFGPETEGELMGTQGPWLAFTGEHDDVDGHSTLMFAHAPRNADAIHTSHWFVRAEPIPTVAFSWAFFEEFALEGGESFEYRYRVVVADGAWDREQVATRLKGLAW
ncbi:DUF6807 family protein [Streptomyces sp. NPDC059744]|uniref:DUF6807 family protein n=1 Tax=Streptomyces sp. NPDC059744 TaxID=3346929 RepID=UPI00365C4A59